MHLARVALASLMAAMLLATVGEAAPRTRHTVVHGWPDMPEGRVLGQAAGVAVDPMGEVVVFHRAKRTWREPLKLDPIDAPTLAVFDAKSGRLVREWGAGLFALPHGLTIDQAGNVWVTDVALNQVMKFDPKGALLLTLGERGVAGHDAAHFNRPTDVAVLADGSFYVSDGYLNTRIMKFDAKGVFQFQWGSPGAGPGQFNVPHGLAVDRQGRVYVADRENDRVQVFDATGRFLAQWKDRAIGRPYGLALLPGDRMAIADGGEQPDDGPDRSGVAIVDLKGHVLERFGRFGLYDGQFWGAHDIAADARGDIYVVDIDGQRVQKFTAR
ncbi:peptidyl-alpha-hydroxyglycine alpha-amidating lyase family protein [Phenylobacterium aquaticum]|uniref:peptidyl-alpha-hydroxyglycine alpha-amidating lyase family protein n=3 Tax=Phenylobacterium aquaticum TaxID=1763816 RepID=UPI0026EB8784|nr:peptidyl-alpha-hydroxyglycine alpha-amidating lyase family protein [Phenylobacterium aquaticum]